MQPSSGRLARHIGLVIGTTEGGIGVHVSSLVNGLRKHGISVAVIGPKPADDRFRFSAKAERFVHWDIADRPRPLRDAAAVLRLRNLLRSFDVVHAHGARAGGLAALALVGRRRPSLIVTLHNLPVQPGRILRVHEALLSLIAWKAEGVMVVSADLADRVRMKGARRIVEAVTAAPWIPPPAGGASAIREELDVQDRQLIVSVGRLADQKGFHTLLQASARWARRRIAPLVVIAGEGPLRRSLASQIKASDLPVRLLGHRLDVSSLLVAADVVVIPSLWEGQSFVAQEAIRAARPLVASDVGAIPDVVGEAALLVPPGDPSALADAVSSVLDDPQLAERLSQAARARLRDLPTGDEEIQAVLRLYRELSEIES